MGSSRERATRVSASLAIAPGTHATPRPANEPQLALLVNDDIVEAHICMCQHKRLLSAFDVLSGSATRCRCLRHFRRRTQRQISELVDHFAYIVSQGAPSPSRGACPECPGIWATESRRASRGALRAVHLLLCCYVRYERTPPSWRVFLMVVSTRRCEKQSYTVYILCLTV